MGLIDSHRKLFVETPALSIEKIIYYLERDVFGFGLLDALMHDQSVEDISCSGASKPVYVWQRDFDSLKTNVMFRSEQDLDDFVMKEVHRAGKHTSAAFPIADVTLPGKHRLAVYYKNEVTPFGSSFTVRKFREDPLTAIDLIETGTIDESVAAYFWLLMDNKLSMMVLGATGAGKTTTLNAVCCLIKPSNKICTIEEISEINLPHENWVSLVARSGFGIEGEGEISLFQLIKSSLRHRPDHLVVGEVRGEEAYVLFQALATGHGGLCTMHADSASSAVQRLGQRPMEISPGNIPLMNCAAVVKKVKHGSRSGGGTSYYGSSRRIVQVSEITDADSVRDIFSWNPTSDIFDIDITSSQILRKIAANNGLTWDELLDEFDRRRIVLGWMAQNQYRDYRTVSNILASYSREPDKIYEKAASSLDMSKREW
ncbi:MAG: type II/IV secretion system ATPase subunit [Thaumarchaeota archaeon]|nr:type II/IV secretion system ATPase subunit [Nitrososphaerota archaeon]